MMDALDSAIANTQAHLESLRNVQGYWEGHLSSSALSTATAIVALALVDREKHAAHVEQGAQWLRDHQNADGGWGDTTISKSNLSTTLLCWSALHLVGAGDLSKTDAWIQAQVGSLEPAAITKAVSARYGKDKTFSVPIHMLCTLCGTLGDKPWRQVLALPFELAALPRSWFGAVGLPVVSYALPALIAIGYTRFKNAPPAWWNPLRWVRSLAWPRVGPLLKALQPSSGGYLEATPLTSFVTMALAGAGLKDHPCVPGAVEFLVRSKREDGGWPIDTNLATWGTTLALRAGAKAAAGTLDWLVGQQYDQVHPFTNAAPGGWAWTHLPGGVPDADDTSSALVALRKLGHPWDRRVEAGVVWLLDLQNRDGGMPTFCRGWGTLPFDRSTPEITAHALLAWWTWMGDLPVPLKKRIAEASIRALGYLGRVQGQNGSWIPLWFGNEHTADENNPVYGTAQVMNHLLGDFDLAYQAAGMVEKAASYLAAVRNPSGSFGGGVNGGESLEETAVVLAALSRRAAVCHAQNVQRIHHGNDPADIYPDVSSQLEMLRPTVVWLLQATAEGTQFPPAPVGLYFARLWYHERLYPVIWTLDALRVLREAAHILSRALGPWKLDKEPAEEGFLPGTEAGLTHE